MITLVLLPGLDGTGLLLNEFAASFGPEVEVIAVPYPDDPAFGYTELEEFARAALPSDRPFFLLGESFSGPIAISIAASAPPGLLGMVLCCSFAKNPMSLLSLARPLVGALPVKALPLGLLSLLVLGRFSTPERRAMLAAALAQVSTTTLQARMKAALSIDVSQLLPAVTVPLLYMRAIEDCVVLPSSATHIASLASDCRVIKFVAPHFLLQVLPIATALTVGEFMAEVASSKPGNQI